MKTKYLFFAVIMILLAACGQKVPATYEVGPYTVTTIRKGVLYDIEDSNHDNPAGVHTTADGRSSMNNCSNIYLVLGKKTALMIDLSNNIRWADNAAESLQQIFSDLAGDRERIIALTHSHGDHTGMAHAFVDDPAVRFYLPKADFERNRIFPAERTTLIEDGYVFDLGKVKVDAIDVKGHTPGSMVYYVEGTDALFSGDAVGSGTGVWIFSLDGFRQYEEGLANLMRFVDNPANKIDKEALTVYGGHAWQKGETPKLTAQYLYDMQAAVEDIEAGKAEWEPYQSGNRMLNANFKHGCATITWNTDFYRAFCAERGINLPE